MESVMKNAPRQVDIDKAGNDRPIFVVGCARSGTTLLQMMLHSHRRIAMPPETRFLMKIYNERRMFGDLNSRENRAAVAAAIVDDETSKFSDLQLDKEAVRKMILNGPPTIGSAAGIVFREYAAKYDKPRWGDKRPNYIAYIEPLLALFPDAQIVHIIRDGRDCVASLKRMSWWNHPFRFSVNKWIQAIEAGNAARQNLRSDQYRELRYEDLVSDPEKELRRLCEFLGEEFDEAMLAPHKTAAHAVPKHKLENHHRALTEAKISTASSGKWREGLTGKEAALMETVAARQLRQYGYALSDQDVELSPKRVRRVASHIDRAVQKASKYREVDARRQQRYGQPVQAVLTTRQLDMYEATTESGRQPRLVPPVRNFT